MATFNVLITDYAWPTLEIERGLLAAVDAELIVAQTGEVAELTQLAPQVDAILTCWKRVTAPVLEAAARCQLVSRYGIGLDNIAVDRASELGMLVTNVPDFCLDEVSDLVMALLLNLARRVVPFVHQTRQGIWNLQTGRTMPRLRGQTLGLIGYGNLAQAVVPKALGFGLKIIAYTPRLAPDALAPFGVATNDLDFLLREADYVSIHAPLTVETRGLIDARALRLMKPTAFLINTARGAIIDERALVTALQERWIAGAALDVLTQEPPPPDHPLLALDNVLITPHTAFYSEAAIAELAYKAAAQVVQVLQGQIPRNLINPAVLTQPNCRFKRE
ncbi:MAG: C-terminal binding protein [Chloroflexi bacterium]|nr:C-terminal binding protein [Chloroflexota bacterium]